MLKKIFISSLTVVIGFGLAFGGIFVWRMYYKNPTSKPEPHLLSEKLPPTELYTLDGSKFEKEKLMQGKVLIVFLSSDCEACKAEIQQLVNIYPNISSQIQIYGISVDTKEKLSSLMENKNINFPIIFDENREIAKSLLVKGVPTKIFIKGGIIEKRMQGKFMDENDAKQKLDLL